MRRHRLVVSAPLDASVPEPGCIAEAERDDRERIAEVKRARHVVLQWCCDPRLQQCPKPVSNYGEDFYV
jgi:hypothetical protein